jgi:anti-anti-sigma factor
MAGRSDLFWVRVENSDVVAHLRLTGRLDSAALPQLDSAMDDADARNIVLDLGGLTFMDGAAWLAMMSHERRAHEKGRDFRIVNAFGAIRQIFESTETGHLISPHPAGR